jgi:hypothetical protein
VQQEQGLTGAGAIPEQSVITMRVPDESPPTEIQPAANNHMSH